MCIRDSSPVVLGPIEETDEEESELEEVDELPKPLVSAHRTVSYTHLTLPTSDLV